MIGVLTDTTASIPEELVHQLGIEVVPYHVHRGLETLRDMVDVEPQEFAEWLQTAGQLPTTSNPARGDYLVGIRHLAQRTKEILALAMTSKGSGAYRSCRAAVGMFREQFPDVHIKVLDTLQGAMSQGWVAIEAARMARDGHPLERWVERAREVAQSGLMIQTADTLRYPYMGGRIGRAKHLVASVLNIKPLIGMQEGVIVALGTARSRIKAYRRMVDLIQKQFGQGARIKVAFTHVLARDQLEQLEALVIQNFECVEIIQTELSPALAVPTGPGTVGLHVIPT